MNELYQQLVGILYGVWRRRWYVMITASLICTVGWIAVATIPNTYTSTARIYVDTDTMLRPLLRGIAIDVNLLRQVDVMRRTLISRPNLEKVIRRSDLDLITSTDEEIEGLIADLELDVRIRDEGANLFRVSYSAGYRELSDRQNAEMARRVVQNLLTIFVESNLGANRQDLASARRFIDEQLAGYERQLEEAERRRAEFKRRNMGLLPGSSNYFDRLRTARGALGKTEAELAETVLVRNELNRQIEKVPAFIGLSRRLGPSMRGGGGLPERIAVLQRQLDALKSRGYTERHPDVLIVQQRYDLLQGQLAEEREAALEDLRAQGIDADAVQAGGEIPNSVYEQIKIRLIEADTKIASLSGRREMQLATVNSLQEKAQSVPVVEADMAKLNRDYEVLRQNYEALLGRRESARIAQDLETKSSDVQFRVIDPPTDPFEASSPNRPLLLTAVLIVGLGAGFVLAVVMSQLKSTYLTANDLRAAFALPVLGSVSVIMSDRDLRQRKYAVGTFAATIFVLVMAYGVLLAIELLRAPLA